MNRFFSLLLTFNVAMCATAQDVLVKKDGSTILSKVIEISDTQVKYKKHSNIDGPTYIINVKELQSINYQNGEKELFNDKESTNEGTVKAKPADDNKEQKEKYASLPKMVLKPSEKKSKDFFPIMAFTDSSVISTNELTVFIEPEAVEYYDKGWKVKLGYSILFVNKTKQPIYIDRANCFRRFNDYDTKSYFDNKQITVSHGNSKSGGVGVGIGAIGIGVGGTSASSHSETYGVDRFLIIGPESKAHLTEYSYIRLSESKALFKTVSDIEYWGFYLNSNDFSIKKGEVITYTEEETPYSNKYFITYSTDQEFKQAYTFEFELYAKYIVGAELKQSIWSMMSPESRLINEIKKTIPDFWTDCMSIIGLPGSLN